MIQRTKPLLTGLISCDRCGFNFQGQSYRKANIFYYVDGGNMNKGSSVCRRLSIRKERLEGFVLDLIRHSLSDSRISRQFEEKIQNYLGQRASKDHQLEELTKQLATIDKKIDNLLVLAEKGLELDSLYTKLQELGGAKERIEAAKNKRDRVEMGKAQVKDAAKLASDFIVHFHKHFETAPV